MIIQYKHSSNLNKEGEVVEVSKRILPAYKGS